MLPTALVFAAFLIAYAASDLAVPSIVRVAVTRRLFDFPDRDRRGHPIPIPRLGGVAVFFGLAVALLAAKAVQGLSQHSAPDIPKLTLAIAAGSAVLFLIGLADDVRSVSPVAKLLGQTAAALLVCFAGFRIDVVSLPPNIEFSLGWASLPLTVLWLVGVSNAFNLIDGLDGLAGGIAVIALLATTGAGIILGNINITWEAFALIGALLGFLRHNIPPAKIFLGDCGSLVVGFLLATLSVKGATRADGAVYALAPIFALSYPLLDTGIAILRRWLRGVPFSRADGRHVHHQLRALGLSPRRAVAAILIQSFAVAVLGLCVTFAPASVTVAVTVTGGVVLFFVFAYGLRWLQYHEFIEASASLTSGVMTARTVIRDKIVARDIERLIARARSMDDIDMILAAAALDFRFSFMGVTRLGAELVTGQSFGDGRLLKLEYPVLPLYEGAVLHPANLLTLSVVCSTDANRRAASPERVARIIAPAIARWIEADEGPRLSQVLSRYNKPLTLESSDTPATAIESVGSARRVSTHK